MFKNIKKKPYKRIALVLSLVLILVWIMLGTGASLAWFTDTSPEIKNIFHFAEFELEVTYRQEDGTYESIEGRSDIFDDEALYEPGYVQVVYLRVRNLGEVPFNLKTAVNVIDYTPATNTFGQIFNLQDHLKFGVATAKTEAELDQLVATRDFAKNIATMNLSRYYKETENFGVDETMYMALVVRMPEEVQNEANYRNDPQPKVELGINVTADQIIK